MNVVICRAAVTGKRFAEDRALSSPDTLFVAPVEGFMRRGKVTVKIKGQAMRAALAIAARPGAIVSAEDMIEWEYGGREDGGPERAKHMMSLALFTARAALTALGYATSREGPRGVSARPLEMVA
jgi:hypothetical protein